MLMKHAYFNPSFGEDEFIERSLFVPLLSGISCGIPVGLRIDSWRKA
jgi:hypothetical protein